jgi:hypothetical protein
LLKVEFTIVDGPEEGGRYEFLQREILLGSDFACDLILVHAEVMPKHARIVDEKDEVFLEDLTGQEETKLNGEYVSRKALHNGDELQIGPYVFHITMTLDESSDASRVDTGPDGVRETMTRLLKRPPVLAFVLLAVIVGIYFMAGYLSSGRQTEDLSVLGPLALPAGDVYGCMVEGKNYIDKVEFVFVGKRPKYRIQYYPGFISRSGLVEILVNDQKIASVPPTIDRWSEEVISVEIPDAVLRMGENNIICFDNVKNPPEATRWGIRDVSVAEVPIPKCDIEVAQKYLNLANEKYGEREIGEGNLFDAVKYLKQGQEYVIACEGSEVKDLLAETMKLYTDELKAKYDEVMFNTKKSLKLKDAASAKFELERAIRYIPDESDPRHRKAKELLEKLEKMGN